MIEIMVLTGLSKSISAMARSQGRAPALFVVLLVMSWLIGEATGMAVAVNMAAQQEETPSLVFLFGLGYIGAALATGIAFMVARLCGPSTSAVSEDAVPLFNEPSRDDPVVHFLKQTDSGR